MPDSTVATASNRASSSSRFNLLWLAVLAPLVPAVALLTIALLPVSLPGPLQAHSNASLLALAGGLGGIGAILSAALYALILRPLQTMGRAARTLSEQLAAKDFAALENTDLRETLGGDAGSLARLGNEFRSELQNSRELLRKVEALSREMEEQVLSTTRMKFEQDSDYFLTAQLIKPLAQSSVRSERVSIDMFVRQKKQFRFKKWDEQLGGDLCVAHSLQLRGRSCTVFLNADAMGKSMQGAGGVLVLGSLFEANIERSKLSLDVQNQSPELWIKHSFVEMQRVFETFESTMFISLVLGVVDDLSGTLYYVNAEHPGMVLYRDGKASFFEQDIPLQKIGFPDVSHRNVKIQVFPMQPGDVIFSGSDGRDDLYVGIGADGERLINDDDNLILNMIELGGGKLDQLVETIDRIGEVTDDLSLIRVGYLEPGEADQANGAHTTNEGERTGAPPPAFNPTELNRLLRAAQDAVNAKDYGAAIDHLETVLQLAPHRRDLYRFIARAASKAGRTQAAADATEIFVKECPYNTDFLVRGAKIMLDAGRIEAAEDLAERYRLRNPESIPNLRLLSQILYRQGKDGRAYVMEKEAEAMESVQLMRSGDAAAAGLIG